MSAGPELCYCGKPLHYSDPASERMVSEMVAELGENVRVKTLNGTFLVPRHYIALHGVTASELPSLGFPKVSDDE